MLMNGLPLLNICDLQCLGHRPLHKISFNIYRCLYKRWQIKRTTEGVFSELEQFDQSFHIYSNDNFGFVNY